MSVTPLGSLSFHLRRREENRDDLDDHYCRWIESQQTALQAVRPPVKFIPCQDVRTASGSERELGTPDVDDPNRQDQFLSCGWRR